MDDLKQVAFSRYWQIIAKRLFPCQCKICKRTNVELVCEHCMTDMQKPENCCFQCGEQMPDQQTTSGPSHCGRCISHPPSYNRTLFAYTYHQHAAALIQQFKFKQDLMLSRFLASCVSRQLIAQLTDKEMPDVLIPIPLHPSRLKQRGFNQSYELAKHIGRQLDIPVYKDTLIRHSPTPKQSGLNRKEREKNIKNAFRFKEPSKAKLAGIMGKHIAILDDVITTSSTVREAAITLNLGKPAAISIIAIAKTQR